MDWNKCIFMAHANEDKPIVRKIYNLLKENGLEPWLDEKCLPPGCKWETEITNAIQKSRFFVAFLSSRSLGKSGYVQKEFRMALSELEKKSPNNTYFIPALLENIELPNISVGTISLKDYQAIDISSDVSLNIFINYLLKEVSMCDVESNQTGYFQTLETIKNLVSENESANALMNLIDLIKKNNIHYYNNVLLLNSRFKQLREGHAIGIISTEEYFFNINKINYSILEIIELIQNR